MTSHYDAHGGAAAASPAGNPAAGTSAAGTSAAASDAGPADPARAHVRDIAAGNATARVIPEATVERLATYLRVLGVMDDLGVSTVSSEELATGAGVNSAMLRKDLSFVGSYGVRGVGYAVGHLAEELANTLGLDERRAVALIGVGNLGQALAGYGGFASRGFRIAALLDVDPQRVGSTLRGLVVRHIDELEEVVEAEQISIAVIATPAASAQQVCDRLAKAGVTAVLNFAPTVLSVPDFVDVRKVDLAAELQILSFHERRKSHDFAGPRQVVR